MSSLLRCELRKPKAKAVDHSARIAQLQSEIANVVEAIASGLLKASPALAARLAAAETEVEQLTRVQAATAAPQHDVGQHLPGFEVGGHQGRRELGEDPNERRYP